MKELTPKQIKAKHRQAFLLTFFDDQPHYETKEVNGFILVKQQASDGSFNVAIYTPENFKKAQEFIQNVPARKFPMGEQTAIE
jgi:hypothetical protein